MQIPVIIEPTANNGFPAPGQESRCRSAPEGATPEEALRNLRAAMDRQLKNGKQLRSVDIASDNPWLALAGMHDANDPLVQEWKQEMAAYRQEIEDDADRP